MLKSFDYDQAMEKADGDTALFGELIEMFDSQHVQSIEELRAAMSAGDFARIELVAHALKGTLNNLGAVAGARMSDTLEAMGREKDLQLAQARLQELTAEIRKFRAEVERVKRGGR